MKKSGIATITFFSFGGALILWALYKWKKRLSWLGQDACLLEKYNIHVISTLAEWYEVEDLVTEEAKAGKVLGLDCEWVPSDVASNPVALLQLATAYNTCVLVRLCNIEQFPEGLCDILADKSIIKAGVACLQDAQKLGVDYGVEVQGCVDLRHLYLRTGGEIPLGLEQLGVTLLNISPWKSAVRMSDWEAEVLSQEQINYAAMDAIVGVQAFIFLMDTFQNNYASQSDAFNTAIRGIVDVSFKNKAKKSTLNSKCFAPAKMDARPPAPIGLIAKGYSTRKSALYHNARLLAPDGELLCTCDSKKAEWYVAKGLGEYVKHKPVEVRLNFQPAGRPKSETDYYLQEKENKCVVCGATDNLVRKHIIPHEYRKYFPKALKGHKSHDVLLVCLHCNQKASQADARLQGRLAVECDAPLGSHGNMKYRVDGNITAVKSAARAILKAPGLPPDRKKELEQVVQDFFGVDSLDEAILQQGAELDDKKVNTLFKSHGERVVRTQMARGSLLEFEKRWRQHFLGNMAPQHLPPYWSVDHSHLRVDAGGMLVA